MKTMNITIGRKLASGIGLLISLLLASIVIAGTQNMSRLNHKRISHDKPAKSNWNAAALSSNACVAQRQGRRGIPALQAVSIRKRQTIWL